MVAAAMRTIFAQPDAEHVREAADDIGAFADFPVPHWKKIWSANPLERLNDEIKRRTDVGGVFPKVETCTASGNRLLDLRHSAGPQPTVVVTRVPPIVFLIGTKDIPNKEARRMASTTKPNPIPDSYRRVTPCLIVQGADKALEFYAEVFAATERMRFPNPDGTVAHAEVEIGDSVVIVEEESPERGTKPPPTGGLPGSPAFLFVYVEDVDDVVARAVKRGAQLQRSPQDQLYGDRDSYIVDPFGHGWTIATHVEDVEPDELMRRMAEMQRV
jgi:PhnB protein